MKINFLLITSLPVFQVAAKQQQDNKNLRDGIATRRLRKTSSFLDLAVDGVVEIPFDGECDHESLSNHLLDICADCDPQRDLPPAGRIDNLCRKARKVNSRVEDDGAAYPWKDISNEGFQFDKEYYDGGTFLNEEYERVNVRDRAPYVETLYEDTAKYQNIEYPDKYMRDNFKNCVSQTVMCCWVQDRQDDNDGNCDVNDCADADPADNTDICAVDLHAARKSNHVKGGFALFPDDSEGESHCHGFVWSNNEADDSYQYRGNNLFYVSMYDHLNVRGYVREVPGAPMCGCLDYMPVVSRSDCTEVTAEEQYLYSVNVNTNENFIEITDMDISFAACTNNDLRTRFDEVDEEGEVTDEARGVFNAHITGECTDQVYNTFLAPFGYQYS